MPLMFHSRPEGYHDCRITLSLAYPFTDIFVASSVCPLVYFIVGSMFYFLPTH